MPDDCVMVIDLNEQRPGRKWLFHGTTAEIAHTIVKVGWAPPDPDDQVRQFALLHGFEPNSFRNQYTSLGVDRHNDQAASCATGWRLAASYARNGPEYLHFARSELTRRQTGATYLPSPPPLDSPVAVLLIEASDCGSDSVGWLPDPQVFSCLPGVDEVVIPGEVLANHVIAVDFVASECSCEGHAILGTGQTLDPRQRCEICFIEEIPAESIRNRGR